LRLTTSGRSEIATASTSGSSGINFFGEGK
jgi:hypothetical protein